MNESRDCNGCMVVFVDNLEKARGMRAIIMEWLQPPIIYMDSKLKPFQGSKFWHDLMAHELKHVWFYRKALKSKLPILWRILEKIWDFCSSFKLEFELLGEKYLAKRRIQNERENA